MAEATSITIERISTEGKMTLYELKSTASNAETITIPSTAPITTLTKIQVMAVNNVSDGTSGGVATVAYSSANKQFTLTDAGASDNDVRVLFYASSN